MGRSLKVLVMQSSLYNCWTWVSIYKWGGYLIRILLWTMHGANIVFQFTETCWLIKGVKSWDETLHLTGNSACLISHVKDWLIKFVRGGKRACCHHTNVVLFQLRAIGKKLIYRRSLQLLLSLWKAFTRHYELQWNVQKEQKSVGPEETLNLWNQRSEEFS